MVDISGSPNPRECVHLPIATLHAHKNGDPKAAAHPPSFPPHQKLCRIIKYRPGWDYKGKYLHCRIEAAVINVSKEPFLVFAWLDIYFLAGIYLSRKSCTALR